MITWSLPSVTPFAGPGNQGLEAIAPWRDGFVAIGYECCGASLTGIVWLSPDGRDWERVPDPGGSFANLMLEHVAQLGDHLILAAQVHPDGPWGLWASSDGRTWTRSATPATLLASTNLFGLAVGPSGVIAYGATLDGRPLLWQSNDGSNWEPSAGTASLGTDPITIAGTASGYVATSYRGAWWSTDGQTWTAAAVESGQHFASGIFVGRDGLLAAWAPERPPDGVVRLGPIYRPTYLQSSDGRSWHLIPTDQQPPLHNVGDQLVADGTTIANVAWSGEIRTSTDGLAWTNLLVSSQGKLDSPGSTFHDFYRLALGTPGLIASGEGGPVRSDTDANVWVGLATSSLPPGPVPTLHLRYNDGRTDARCIGGEGGDPGVVCITIGYYLRNDSTSDVLVQMSGAVNSVVSVPAGSVGMLTEIGPVWDSGKPVDVKVLAPDCSVTQEVHPTGDLALVVIHADGHTTVTEDLPPVQLPPTPFAASACSSPTASPLAMLPALGISNGTTLRVTLGAATG
jgi:hypothetical protein